jgi:Sperm-tail PG-rich repeat
MRPTPKPDMSGIGPGTYNVAQTAKITNLSKVAFASSIDRQQPSFEETQKMAVPPIGTYEVNRSILKEKPYKQPPNTSSFAQSVKTDHIKSTDIDKIKRQVVLGEEAPSNIVIMGELKELTPGPGNYQVDRSFHQAYDQKEFNSKVGVTMQGAKRFTERIPTLLNPGPGQYKIKNCFDIDQYQVYHSVFMSETSREKEVTRAYDSGQPIDPTKPPKKKAFHSNINKQWV